MPPIITAGDFARTQEAVEQLYGSEFRNLLDCLKRLGVSFEINWSAKKEDWQQIIVDAGHNFTAHACCVVEVQQTQFLFMNQIFILTRDKASGKVELQRRMNGNGVATGERRIVYFTDGNQTLEDLQRVDPRAR
jgi:hypothetical protein